MESILLLVLASQFELGSFIEVVAGLEEPYLAAGCLIEVVAGPETKYGCIAAAG